MSEPSWSTALSEAKSASRHLDQAVKSMERLSRELQALRDTSETTARLDLAHALTEGSDGGVLQCLVAAASEEGSHTAQIVLARLTAALGLAPVCQRGELLRLSAEELGEFDVRGGPHVAGGGQRPRRLYCVVRPGWLLDALLVARPVLDEAADNES